MAIKDIPNETIIAQYGGYRLYGPYRHKNVRGNREAQYKHSVGVCDVVLDIPEGYEDVSKYNGTLAHKCNHNFLPNVDHYFVSNN